MNEFKLKHVALYAKGWYKKSNKSTIYDDLRKCLTKDGYMGQYFTNNNVVYKIVDSCKDINLRCFNDFAYILTQINVDTIWQYGYLCKENTDPSTKDWNKLPNYDYLEAILYYYISSIRHLEKQYLSENSLPHPDYKNCLPRPNNIKNKQLEIFGESK